VTSSCSPGLDSAMGNTTHDLVRLVSRVQDLPYAWPGPWGANATRNAAKGTWAGKHALLAEELRSVGVRSQPLQMVGALVPPLWPDLLSGAEDVLEVHECLTVETDWAGPLLVDVTWHPAAVRQGLPGTLAWSGLDDMVPAVQPQASYAVSRTALRTQKLALRARIYEGDQAARRERVLTEMAERAIALASQEEAGGNEGGGW